MRIGFDAKRVFHNQSGLGNYSRDMVRGLIQYFPQHQYLLYNPRQGKVPFTCTPPCSEVRPVSLLHRFYSAAWRRSFICSRLKKDNLTIFHGLSNELPHGIARTGIPSIVTIHDLIFYKYPQWYKPADRFLHRQKVRQATREASHIIAISEQTKKDIVHYLQVPEEKITVLYQGCAPAFKQTYGNEEKLRVATHFKLPPQFILSVGTIENRKNLLTTVKSLQHHNLPLVVIGRQTNYFKEITHYIKTHGLEDRVHFLQQVNMQQLAIIYQLAFCFCYPSIYEGFGIPIIEALYSGTPVITNKDGCFKEAGGPDSFYIDVGDEIAMAAIINNLLANPQLLSKTAQAGMQYAQQFNDDIIANRLMQLYQQVSYHSAK